MDAESKDTEAEKHVGDESRQGSLGEVASILTCFLEHSSRVIDGS